MFGLNNKDHVIKIVLSLLIAIMAASVLLAQRPNLKFKDIKQSDGLINGTVQTIFEDSFGFIWLGTHQGVQRYDGKAFRSYIHSDLDTTGLSQNYINRFCEDENLDVWIATSYGLNRYDRKTDKIERYRWRNKMITKNSEPSLPALMTDPTEKNILWILSRGIGLIKLDIRTDSAVIYPLDSDSDPFPGWLLPYPGDTNKILTGSNKLFSFDKSTGHFEKLTVLPQNAEVPNNLINAAASDPGNKNILWFATGDGWGRGSLGGIMKYNLDTRESVLYSAENRKDEIPSTHFMSICFHDKNNLWIGTRTDGALLYQLKEDRFYNYKHNVFDEGSFVTVNAVRSIFRDKSGTCWFGSWGDGISILSPAAQKFTHYKHLPDNSNELAGNYINSFAEDGDGNIWIGTNEGGLSKFNPKDKTFENFFQEFKTPGHEAIQITYLFYDSKENLWVGTFNDALYKFNPRSGEITHYIKGRNARHVTQKRITAINELKEGEILISTYGGGLNIYSYNTDSFKHYLHDPDDSTSIPDNQIWLPFKGEDGNYYFGGNSIRGLIQFNPVTEDFRHITNLHIVTFMMPVRTSDGRVYIDEVANGLREINIMDSFSVATIYDNNGNSINNIEGMLVDDQDDLWIGTGTGLIEFNPETKFMKKYDVDDGLQGYQFNRLSALKATSGEMYFGGQNGFNVFHPDKIATSNYSPPLVFSELRLYQEQVDIGEDSPLKQNILLTDELVLNYDQNDFSISFAALDFSNPDNIEYKYLLENHDDSWIYAGNKNVANYTNMDPGKYTLKVLATNSDGIWNVKAQSIRIIINPPWWLTKWAYMVYSLIIIACIFLVDRIQRRRLLEREKTQAREKELAQAKEIEKAYTRLKNTQEQLLHSEKMASLGELTAGIAHEIQNPLNFVNNFSEVNRELITELKEEIEKGDLEEVKTLANDIERNEKKITHHGQRADGIVKGMLLHSRSGAGKKEPTYINVLADEYLRLSYHGLRAKDKSFNADFTTDFDKTIPPLNIIPQEVGRVILNLINNAFHAVSEKKAMGNEDYKPLVTVRTKLEEDCVKIGVKDNGNGIPEDVLDKIFQPFFTTKQAGEGTGLGLSLSYDIIINGHGGELIVETSENEGSEFVIHLPIDKNE